MFALQRLLTPASGIKAALLHRLFDSFVQADSGIQRKYGGSGLGLSIASELIRMMGGKLKVDSDYGHGSHFYFDVTLKKLAAREASPLLSLADRKFIFLVSYSESNAYKSFFTRLGSQATLLHSSQDLRGCLSVHQLESVHEVLIDDSVGIISMITCRNLADSHGLGDRAVALIRSGFTKENMDLLKRNGFKRFLIKPLKPWDLLNLPPRDR
ncbi:MAG: hypothetical protein HC883_01395 [Bdellovibrionaceae bacterium]|nr:hypothetical protein [Pseudobdellovibrionaceae bacterium]